MEVNDPQLRPSKTAAHGDYQANLALSLAKQLGRPPREIAESVASALRTLPACEGAFAQVEVLGPGFLNLHLSSEVVSARLSGLLTDPRVGVAPTETPETVVVDYSSPNLAKEMHVGHLRSTIIGDAICRVLEFHGDRVIRQNHLGDWGTQFGMLIEYLIDTDWNEANSSIADLNELYQQAKHRFDQDPAFANRSRARVVDLQGGGERSRDLWQRLIHESVRHMNTLYRRMGVLLEDSDIRPESFYNSMLPDVVAGLREVGLLQESEGALVVFPEGMSNKNGDPLPLFVQKSDGGYGYGTTDLAAVRYRVSTLGATRVVYVVDARQADHFKMVFWTARAAGWADAGRVRFEHVTFGTILDANRRPFKTRAGGTIKLSDLLEEAEKKALDALYEKSPDSSEAERNEIAPAIAIGAVKYGDLCSERIKDYAFDPKRMVAFEGNTAPYLQYAYVRIQSIFRKGDVSSDEGSLTIRLDHPSERALGLHVLRFGRAVDGVVQTLEPHRLCAYLYELASAFHTFHHECSVLKAESEEIKGSRLALCAITAKTLSIGLHLLGIRAIERM